MSTFAFFLMLGLGAGVPSQDLKPEVSLDELDLAYLAKLKIGTTSEELLARLKNQTGDPKLMARARQIIPSLASEDFETREKASRELASMGSTVLEVLRENANNSDPEVSRRVRDTLESIEETQSVQVLGVILRRLIRFRDKEAVPAILRLAATRGEPDLQHLIQRNLGRLVSDEAARVELEKALKDETPRVRGLAGVALAGHPAGKESAKSLLKDPEHTVRWRVALALGRAGEESVALPAVISELPFAGKVAGFEMEDWLHQVAGESGPAPLPWPGDQTGRTERQKAWLDWQANRPAKKATNDRTLTVLLDEGIVRLLDKANQPLWELKEVAFPLDAEYLPGGRVLVAEHGANRVTIRSPKNEIIWERQIEMPLAAQRTSHGTILVTTSEMVIELDGEGVERARFSPEMDRPCGLGTHTTIMKAQALPGGELGLVTQRRELGEDTFFVRLDPDWRELGRIPVNVGTSGGRIDWRLNGSVLVPELDRNRVVEYDAKGKELWVADAEVPVFAMRTPTGTTLITSRSDAGAREVDLKGKVIWNYKAESRVTRAIRLP